MDLLQQLQEKYIEEFSNNVPLGEFIFNIVITALLVTLLRLFYIRYGQVAANRRRFAANFLPLALGTLLIIMIVKSSIALSLGLVGALSIVRYRAAIKDPEELTYLFIAIGIGLAGGANQPILAIVAFAMIMILLLISRRVDGAAAFRREHRLFINITTDEDNLNKVTKILTAHLTDVELKRMDTLRPGLDLTFVGRADSVAQLSALNIAVQGLSTSTRMSIIDHAELPV